MNRVITINLNSKAYQLEEAGYEALRKYLDEAKAALRDDPDRDEIMADFEQAVADKCEACLTNGKNVIATKEIEEIIAKMGPVDGAHGKSNAGEKAGAAADGAAGTSPKRLYRIVEGSVFRGVCMGVAAYFNMDPTLVRVIFILLTIFTSGIWIIVYFALSFVMPVARTADEVAQAHGEPPFTAKDFIDHARAEYAKFAVSHVAGHAENKDENKNEWKQRMRAWKHEVRFNRRAWRAEWRKERQMQRAEQYGHCGGGFGAVVGTIITLVLAVILVSTLWSLVFHGMVFGHPFGIGHPLWVSIVFLLAAFSLVSFPFRHITPGTNCGGCGERHCRRHGGSLCFLVFLALFIYTSIILFPAVHELWGSLVTYLQAVR
jgi:phage shock protein PspC (stress-responsive transcriptional regulator)